MIQVTRKDPKEPLENMLRRFTRKVQQSDEFEELMPLERDTPEMKKQKEQAALTWLETNFPDYKQVVAGELEKLKAEVKAAAPQILDASGQAAQQPPQAPPAPPVQ